MRSQSMSKAPGVGTPDKGREFRLSRVPTYVGTFDGRRRPASRTIGVGTPGLGQDFRLSRVLTHVGISDTDSHRKNNLRARGVLECLSIDFIFMLEHSIFLRPTKFASLFILRRILNSKAKIKPLESALSSSTFTSSKQIEGYNFIFINSLILSWD